MGFVCVVDVPIQEGKTGPQVVEQIHRRLELLGAVKTGTFTVDCDSYQSQVPTAQRRLVNIMHNSETPATCYAVLDNGMCLLADNLFDLLVMKLKPYYVQRRSAHIESKGQRYELGDFIIKVGSVTAGETSTFKGILVEAEYSACVIGAEAWGLVKEFLQGFLGSCVSPCLHLKNTMTMEYTSSDTIHQYLEHYNNYRKTATIPGR